MDDKSRYSDQDPALREGAVFNVSYDSSAGQCQELCMKETQKISFLFGIKDQKCVCFKHSTPISCSLDSCKTGIGTKCSTYRTYLSGFETVERQRTDRFPPTFPDCIAIQCTSDLGYKVRHCESNFATDCKIQDAIKYVYHSNRSNVHSTYKMKKSSHYFGKNDEYFLNTTCKSGIGNISGPVWISLSRENYTRFDKGETLSHTDRRNIISCQFCDNGCRCVDCNNEVDKVQCSKTILTTKTNTTTAPKRTNVVTKRITKYSSSNTDREGISKTSNERKFMARETTQKVSRYPRDYSDQTLSYSLDTTTSTNNVRELHSTTFFKWLALCLVAAICFICIAIGLAVFCRRRKRTSTKMGKTEKHKTPSDGENLTEDSKMNTLKSQISSNKRCKETFAYEMADNSILEEVSPYTEAGEGHYDHLRDTASRRQVDEGIYNHLTNAGHVTTSGYDVMQIKNDVAPSQSDFRTDSHEHAYSRVTLGVHNETCKFSKLHKELE